MKEQDVKKGTKLEIATAAYFQTFGFLVRNDVKLTTAASMTEVTDIDLIGIRFDLPLKEIRIIADCKDRRRAKPFERILWTRGLASYANADQSVVVVPNAPWQAREFASQGKIEVLEEDEIFSALESKHFSPFGEADYNFIQKFYSTKSLINNETKENLKENSRLRQMLVFGHPLTNLNRVLKILSTLGKNSIHTPNELWMTKFLCFDAAIIASVMLVRFAEECKWTKEVDWVSYAKKKLTYGDMPPNKARQLARVALDTEFYDGLPAPPYTDEIIQLIKQMIIQSDIASILPFTIDYQLFGQTLGGIQEDRIPVFGDSQNDSKKMAKRLLSALSYAAEVSMAIWDYKKNTIVEQNKHPLNNLKEPDTV